MLNKDYNGGFGFDFFSYTCTQLYAGRLADKIGGERILVISTLFWALLTLFTPKLFDCAYWSGNPLFFLLLLRVATGVGQGLRGLPFNMTIA